MKILFIGNSFSVDANAYLRDIADAAGYDLVNLNLYIGGCSLKRHARNALEDLRDYQRNTRGDAYEGSCTLLEGLRADDWEYISVQQVSGLSGLYYTYHPYIDTVLDLVKRERPKAKIVVHETWAYEKGSTHEAFANYDCSQDKMHAALKAAYTRIAREIGADRIVPCGDVIAQLRKHDEFNIEKGGESLARDGFHLSLTYGRYAAAATWFQKMGMGDIEKNDFVPEGCDDPKKMALIKKTVKEIC